MTLVEAPALATADVATLPDDELELGIRSFTARLAAATCVYLLALAEFDRRGVWSDQNALSMVHWMAWRCAMSPTTAREHLRLGHALAELPLLRSGFASGKLTYSQARAISRVATPADEATFVELADSCTASQLERICAAYRRCKRLDDPDAAAAARARRSLQWRTNDDGTVTMTARLTAEDAAVVRKAVGVAMGRRDDQAVNRPVREVQPGGADDPVAANAADALVDAAAAYLAHAADAADHDRERYTVTVVVEHDALAGSGSPATATTDDGFEVARTTAERLSCDQPYVQIVRDRFGRCLDVGRRTRRIPKRLMRAIRLRDDGHCSFPGCQARRVEVHHARHWAKGGATDLDNLTSLCGFHHHRHHDGGFQVEPDGRGGFRFIWPSGQVITAGRVATPPVATGDCGVVPDVDDCSPTHWAGERADLHWITSVLLQDDTDPGGLR